ncbi:MAG: quinol:cytochrome C oxidoreductase, partial [Gammaproteobacteria bacterium]|nr:quinol:cytochrome C oxidoreductase [Gammaproteobacteria bacterium]
IIRTMIYFVVWYVIANYFFKKSVIQDEDGNTKHTLDMQKTSTYSMFLFAGTLTFASFDFLMSLEPHWYSTIFGVYYFSGGMVGFFAILGLLLITLRNSGYLKDVVNVEHYHDIGKLLFGFNIFWAYIAFSQYFLIWYGNIPEETLWYLERQTGGWLAVSILLVVGHLIVPLLLFMSRNIKRNIKLSFFMYAWMFFMHLVDIYYIVMPTATKHHGGEVNFHFSILDLLWLFGIGGIYLSVTLARMKKFSLFPMKDPRLQASLSFENF